MFPNKTYLGDSVYAQVENGMIKLTTENGYATDPSNTIYLERDVYYALRDYVLQAPLDTETTCPESGPNN